MDSSLDFIILSCYCGLMPVLKVSFTEANPGKRFFNCRQYGAGKSGINQERVSLPLWRTTNGNGVSHYVWRVPQANGLRHFIPECLYLTLFLICNLPGQGRAWCHYVWRTPDSCGARPFNLEV
ncbi:hypothetical protein JCGZ_06449 [Jatropha curcas]|uniref:Zinc finger GRF-type domain-containing protein n=1 Tax=Jatropha curcas TaxID=180498 RepID=A0A067KZV9_JATCU|nr:hypothetical protein JCGZ_06449 [Jatropha curcas]